MKSNSKIIDHYVVGSDGNAVRDMAQTVYLSEYERNLNYWANTKENMQTDQSLLNPIVLPSRDRQW